MNSSQAQKKMIQEDLQKPGMVEELKSFTWKLDSEGFDYAVSEYCSGVCERAPSFKFVVTEYVSAKDKVLKALSEYVKEAIDLKVVDSEEDLPVDFLIAIGVLDE